MANQNGFDSDEQEQYYLELERQKQEESQNQDFHEQLLYALNDCASYLGINYCISYLESLKE